MEFWSNSNDCMVRLGINNTKYIREESYIHESILFGFPGNSDDAIAINYCMLYAKYCIYLKKLK